MTKDEALRLALVALKTIDDAMPFPVAKLAIKECTAALEAKDEPWEQFYPEMGKPKLAYLSPTELPENYCYILPQRTWVALTDEEIDKAWRSVDHTIPYAQFRIDVARAIEAKVRSKNENR
jgi:hypothetical protein